MTLIVDFDHADPAVSASLLDWGTRLRATPGLARSERHGGFWIVARHRDILQVLRETNTFICSERVTLPPQNSPVPVIPLESDEPNHSFYRSVFQPVLAPKVVASYEAKLRRIVSDALNPILESGNGDAVIDFAARIPTRAMAAIFGLTDEDAYRTDGFFTALVEAASGTDSAKQKGAVNAYKNFLLKKLSDRRREPSDNDFVSAILAHEADGRKYNEEECLGLMWSAAGGAIDTTKHAIGHVMHLLGTRRDIRKRLIDQPRLIPFAIEESLRLNPSAFMVARYVAQETVLADTKLSAGERVLLVYGYGNRDADAFIDPDEPVLDRPPNRILTFGQGIHQCVGMHLARFEVKIAIEEVLKRMPNYTLCQPTARPILHGGMMWAHSTLPMMVNDIEPVRVNATHCLNRKIE